MAKATIKLLSQVKLERGQFPHFQSGCSNQQNWARVTEGLGQPYPRPTCLITVQLLHHKEKYKRQKDQINPPGTLKRGTPDMQTFKIRLLKYCF